MRPKKFDIYEDVVGIDGIGRRIARLRIEKGLSQQALADELGVNMYTISKWENNTLRMSQTHIVNVANYFGVTESWLLNGIDTDSDRDVIKYAHMIVNRPKLKELVDSAESVDDSTLDAIMVILRGTNDG